MLTELALAGYDEGRLVVEDFPVFVARYDSYWRVSSRAKAEKIYSDYLVAHEPKKLKDWLKHFGVIEDLDANAFMQRFGSGI